MSVLRRFVFGLLAVCTALGVGIALCGGPLQGNFVNEGRSTDAPSIALRERVAALGHRQLLSDAVTSVAADRLLRAKLTGQTVTVVVLPGVPEVAVTGLTEAVHSAGALTAVVVRLSADLVDPAKKTYVDSVAASSMKNRADVASGRSGETYEQIGALVARAYVGAGGDTAFDEEAAGIDAELQGARLVTVDSTPARRGSLVAVLAPRASAPGEFAVASTVIQARLVATLAAKSAGAVLVAPPPAVPRGLVVSLSGDRRPEGLPLSTLSADVTPATSVLAVYALAAAAASQYGDFGAEGHSVSLPPGLAPARD